MEFEKEDNKSMNLEEKVNTNPILTRRCCVCKTIQISKDKYKLIGQYDPTQYVFSDGFFSQDCVDYNLISLDPELVSEIRQEKFYIALPKSCRDLVDLKRDYEK